MLRILRNLGIFAWVRFIITDRKDEVKTVTKCNSESIMDVIAPGFV